MRGFEKTRMTRDSTLQRGSTIQSNNYIDKYNLMKKTREAYFREYPDKAGTSEISGCREFEGEDLKYDSRREFFKNKQKQWLDQQIEEKRQREAQEKYEQQLYDQQTLELNRMRGMLEDNFAKTKAGMVTQTKQTNQQLDFERKEKERLEREAALNYQKEEAEYLKRRGEKQDFYMDVK